MDEEKFGDKLPEAVEEKRSVFETMSHFLFVVGSGILIGESAVMFLRNDLPGATYMAVAALFFHFVAVDYDY